MNDEDAYELELERTTEIEPGVWVERRNFLGLAAACLWVGAGARTGAATDALRAPDSRALPPDAHLSFAEFLAEIVPIARELVRDESRVGEDRYLHTLAAYAVRLSDVPVPEMRQNSSGDRPKTYIGSNEGGDPFTVLHWRMEPSAVILIHAHTFGNVVTVGLQGSACIQNFEMVGERDFKARGTFAVRKCKEQILLPGEINLVPLSHGYCHGFRAGPQGARGLDITTRLREKGPVPLLDVSAKATDTDLALFDASWKFA